MSPLCGHCIFWFCNSLGSDGYEGECRRHAPQAMMAAETLKGQKQKTRAYWPRTVFDDWCGEGQEPPKPKIETDEWTPTEIVDVDPEGEGQP